LRKEVLDFGCQGKPMKLEVTGRWINRTVRSTKNSILHPELAQSNERDIEHVWNNCQMRTVFCGMTSVGLLQTLAIPRRPGTAHHIAMSLMTILYKGVNWILLPEGGDQ
jgi:hypothetical protein